MLKAQVSKPSSSLAPYSPTSVPWEHGYRAALEHRSDVDVNYMQRPNPERLATT